MNVKHNSIIKFYVLSNTLYTHINMLCNNVHGLLTVSLKFNLIWRHYVIGLTLINCIIHSSFAFIPVFDVSLSLLRVKKSTVQWETFLHLFIWHQCNDENELCLLHQCCQLRKPIKPSSAIIFQKLDVYI